MILKALYDYYNRSGDLAPAGFEEKEIPFVIVIDDAGNLQRIEDCRIDGKNSRKYLVVKDSRTSAPKPYIFYDNLEYVLNYTKDHEPLSEADSTHKKKVAAREKKIAKSKEKHDLFVRKCELLYKKYIESKEFKAVLLFYSNNSIELVKEYPLWEDMKKKLGADISFLLQGETKIVAEAPELANEIEKADNNDDNDNLPYCLVTGEKAVPVETTAATMIPGSQATAKLVAFQINSGYDSYGKLKGNNAPISKEAESAYTTALNKLLSKNSHNKFLIGSRTFLFWASSNNKASQMEIGRASCRERV